VKSLYSALFLGLISVILGCEFYWVLLIGSVHGEYLLFLIVLVYIVLTSLFLEIACGRGRLEELGKANSVIEGALRLNDDLLALNKKILEQNKELIKELDSLKETKNEEGVEREP
jgi:hypothetical protein